MGLENTHFENPNGLDSPGHYSTPRDLAVLAAYAMENPIFAQTVSTKTVSAGGRSLRNHNKLLWRIEGADGVKTGFTKAAGRILVSSATRQGRRLVAVTMNDPNDWQDHANLLEQGFADFSVRQIVRQGQCLGTVEVAGGEAGKAELLAAEEFSYALTPEEQPEIVLRGPGFVYAPVVRGQNAGWAYVCLGEKAVGKIPLVYGNTVEQEKEPERSFWQKLFGGERR